MTMLLSDAYLCPGPAIGLEHITDNPVCCDCGNANLISLGRVLDRKPYPAVDVVDRKYSAPAVDTFIDRIWNRREALDS